MALLSRRDPAQLHDRAGHFGWREAISVGPGLTALLGELLDPDPAQRPQSGRALLDRLHRMRRLAATAPPPGSPAPPAGEDRPGPRPTAIPPAAPVDLAAPFEPPTRFDAGKLVDGVLEPMRSPPSSRLSRILPAVVLPLIVAAGFAVTGVFISGEPTPVSPAPRVTAPQPAPEAVAPALPDPGSEPSLPDLSKRTELTATHDLCVRDDIRGRIPDTLSGVPLLLSDGVEVAHTPQLRFPPEAREVLERDRSPRAEFRCELRLVVDGEGLVAEAWVAQAGCLPGGQRELCDHASEFDLKPEDPAFSGPFQWDLPVNFRFVAGSDDLPRLVPSE